MKQNSVNPAPPHRLGELSAAGCSHSALRHLFLSHSLGPGSRLLIIGDRDWGLSAIARSLGIDADQGQVDVVQALFESRCVDKYDAIVVRSLVPVTDNLRSTAAIDALRELLEMLQPGGQLIMFPQVGSSFAMHDAACFERLLRCFAGRVTVKQVTSWVNRLAGWLGVRRATELIATLYPTAESARSGNWLGDMTLRHPSLQSACCPQATAMESVEPAVRRAA